MGELFSPSLDDQISCIRTEIIRRRVVYPRRVSDHKITQHYADLELSRMGAVLLTLTRLHRGGPADER